MGSPTARQDHGKPESTNLWRWADAWLLQAQETAVMELPRLSRRQQATTRAQQCSMLDVGIDRAACLVHQLELLPRPPLVAQWAPDGGLPGHMGAEHVHA
jgi:hypothetical protein